MSNVIHMPTKKGANRIGRILEERGITNKWLADQIKVSPAVISSYVNNKAQPPLKNACEIARVLGVQVEDLIAAA